MRKRNKKRILGRKAAHRQRLLENLSQSLLQHEAITTTHAKALALRSFLEPLISRARGEVSLATRRLLLSQLHHTEAVAVLLEVAEKQERTSGFLRVTKLPPRRNDGAEMSRVEILPGSLQKTKV